MSILNLVYGVILMATMSFAGGCDQPGEKAAEVPAPQVKPTSAPTTQPAGKAETAVFAGGCFWCVEGVFLQLDGVTSAVSGYTGGTKETANYEAVCSGTTGHAEAVKVTWDPAKISYGDLLRVFFTTIDPTTKNRQGPDSGTQYRSVIFYETPEQKETAEAYIKQLDATKIFPRPIVTTVEPLKSDAFYPAEDYHQNYVACHLNNPYVQHVALPKIEKVREKFPSKLKPAGS